MKRFALVVLGGPALVAAFSFASGVLGYISGTARLATAGYPGFEFGNLDRDYRVHWRTSGCMVTGFEVLTHLPNNLAVRAMVTAFGPMPGAFRGPYPTREQAREALRNSSTIVDAGLAEWPVQGDASGGCVQLAAMVPIAGQPVGRCAEFEGDTLIVGYQDRASLIDRTSGERYARYRIH